MPCYSLGVTRCNLFKVGHRGNLNFFLGISGLGEVAKKKGAPHVVCHNFESQKQIYFWYRVKNRRIGAEAILTLRTHQKKKERKTNRKRHKNREERAQTH